MGKYHLYHISFFDSLMKGLQDSDVPLHKLTTSGHLKRFDLDNPDTYLPIEVAYEFLTKSKYTEGIDCISGEFYSGFEMEDLSEYGKYMSAQPDLYSILINGIRYDYLIQTSGKLTLQTHGAISRFSMLHTDGPSEGRELSERINMAMMLKAFQTVWGNSWTPLEVHVTSENAYWLNKLLPNTDYKVKTGCREIAVVFKTSELAGKNPYYTQHVAPEHEDMTSIEAITNMVLESSLGIYIPTVEEFSGFFAFSKRTLMRNFKASGASYKALVDQHLYLRSLRLLEHTHSSVEDISVRLGYAHPSNFIKAFKRWSNTTPNQYRTQRYSL